MHQAIARLEFDAVKTALVARTTTPLGAARANALVPFDVKVRAIERIDRICEARRLIERDDAPPVEGGEEVSAALELGEKGVMLEGAQLRAIAGTMQSSARLRLYLLGHEDDAPLLYGLGAGLADLGRIGNQVMGCFEPSGRLADNASDDLGPLRKRHRSLQGAVEEKLEELMKSPRIARLLQENYFTIRGDRYVLPVKASFQSQVKGIVHDASGTGQTVFIEPQAVVDAGNRLKIAASEVLEEEHRILAELTLLVVAEADAVREAMGVIGTVDLIAGGARLSSDLECAAIRPSEAPGFNLVKSRHPQLVLERLSDPGARLVPNDIGLGESQRILILTGPNTGGKTVAMKTVGLFALMVRCGLHLPCDDRSSMGWFENIEVAIGDDQSIASHLSTFAAHIQQISDVAQRSSAQSLVLVDEIAADTDPTQGQALAQAMLECFADRNAHAVVTTHFEGLKAIPFADDRFRNAGVGFDPQTLRPTYRVTLDVPQGSNGFDIAQSLGLPIAIVDRARSLTTEGSRAIDTFMKNIEARATELDQARQHAERAEAEAVAARAEMERATQELADEKRKLRDGAQADLLREIEQSRDNVREIIAKLQATASSEAVRDAMRDANETAEVLATIEEQEQARAPDIEPSPSDELEPLDEVSVGDWVHVARLGNDGTVVAVDGRECVVAVGNMRTRVPTGALRRARTRAPKKERTAERIKRPRAPSKTTAVPAITSSEEIDVRGLNTDESLSRLDGFLDHHYGGSSSHIRVIHGHGSGALRGAIRAHLKRSGYVRGYRPGDEKEGGDGATVVELA